MRRWQMGSLTIPSPMFLFSNGSSMVAMLDSSPTWKFWNKKIKTFYCIFVIKYLWIGSGKTEVIIYTDLYKDIYVCIYTYMSAYIYYIEIYIKPGYRYTYCTYICVCVCIYIDNRIFRYTFLKVPFIPSNCLVFTDEWNEWAAQRREVCLSCWHPWNIFTVAGQPAYLMVS